MAVLFGVQIYCDFSGYTDIARGAARMMGIRLMENFQSCNEHPGLLEALAHQSDALVYGLCVYSAWWKPARLCKALPERADRVPAEWLLAWSILELCGLGSVSRSLHGWFYMHRADSKRQKENPASGDRVACDHDAGECFVDIFQNSFDFGRVADFDAGVCESAGRWNLRNAECLWHPGCKGSAPACGASWLADPGEIS